MGTVQFKTIPQGLTVPLFYAEIDNSQGNSAQPTQAALLIGAMTTGGSATAGFATPVQDQNDARAQFGPGSQLSRMTGAYRNFDGFGQLYGLPVDDAGGAVAASGSLALSGTATAAGTLALYVAGVLVPVSVNIGDTAAVVAGNVATAVNANTDLPVTASATTGTVTLTAVNKGLTGNDVDIELNYLGRAAGQITPAGITPTITAMTGGTTNPTLTTALANLSSTPFDYIGLAFNDAGSIAALTGFLSDTAGRWSYLDQLFGHWIAAFKGTYSAILTEGGTLNDQHGTVMPSYGSPSWTPEWAASLTAAVAVTDRANPGLPIRTMALQGILPPPIPDQFTLSEQQALLNTGMSIFNVVASSVIVAKLVTTYRLNAFGQPDNSYQNIETMMLLKYIIRRLKTVVTSRYGQVKLTSGGAKVQPGSGVVTPSIIKADLIAEYQQMETEGYVQNSSAFAQMLVVQQNDLNPNRIDVLWPGTLADLLDVFALQLQFRLQ